MRKLHGILQTPFLLFRKRLLHSKALVSVCKAVLNTQQYREELEEITTDLKSLPVLQSHYFEVVKGTFDNISPIAIWELNSNILFFIKNSFQEHNIV